MTEIFKFLKGLSVFCVAQEVHLEPEDKSHNETHFAQYKECSKSVRAMERMNRLLLCKVVNPVTGKTSQQRLSGRDSGTEEMMRPHDVKVPSTPRGSCMTPHKCPVFLPQQTLGSCHREIPHQCFVCETPSVSRCSYCI